ncbi:hypothetical protein GCM10010245_63400 [Streptomyces spectabilis]|nr:hypothetical protein GCM10010245_63400 [Streptomyces spectabilis]
MPTTNGASVRPAWSAWSASFAVMSRPSAPVAPVMSSMGTIPRNERLNEVTTGAEVLCIRYVTIVFDGGGSRKEAL